MKSSEMIKKTLQYQKEVLDSVYNSMVILQGQTEKLTTDLWKNQPVFIETLKALDPAISECKTMRDNLKKNMDESFNKIEAMFE